MQFRLVIKLKATTANREMLQLISGTVGGRCVEGSTGFILWVENSRERIAGLLVIFEQYPPLTARTQLQLQFFREMFSLSQSPMPRAEQLQNYFSAREKKYAQHPALPARAPANLVARPYFCAWLSGFIEAGGCFSVRACNTVASFSIGQKYEPTLLLEIQEYFRTNATVRPRHGAEGFYYLETCSLASLLRVVEHVQCYPLLGEKRTSFARVVAFLVPLSK